MGRIGCNIGNPDNWLGDEPRDYSNRAPDRAVEPEALQSVQQALMRSIAEGKHATSAEPYTITVSPGMHNAICTAMGVESFTLQELITWAAREPTP